MPPPNCLQRSVSSYGVNPDTGQYVQGLVLRVGNETTTQQEEAWIQATAQSYADQADIGTYFSTSPYSQGEYKFVVTCLQWEQYSAPAPVYNNNPVPPPTYYRQPFDISTQGMR